MGYWTGALRTLDDMIGTQVPIGGRFLDIGSQDISAATAADLRPIMRQLHGDGADALIAQRFADGSVWKVADLFKGSPYNYQSIDLYPGESIIQADLNTFAVPPEYRGAFDVVSNQGSTEHIFDQTNVFRCIHAFARVGGLMWHAVPVVGYYNHGLYNYHPLFFVFLARANKYEIEAASISGPHLEHTIPRSPVLHGSESWRGIRQSSGMLDVILRKTTDAPFTLFTDYDQAVMGEQDVLDDWTAMMKDRYDLRVRD